ncbi:MAG TPA: phospho-N-acetylmuramoyl-pentapeptide-transferase [Elusimicrobia bacterium]|nr:MAG: phospho-N-acetylmuramoyl-pentapeptide-transferase [Elusimicrobia bacterium GWD2_63_28]HCC48077.1 phospho-N-acetylmuramoyl-pentapeptide-transferase [Elusimicrobiota bacterium]
MLYYAHYLKDFFSPLNVFQYITFRAGGAVITSFLLSLLIGPWLIAKLRTFKIGQIQRTDGPQSHLAKQGTTTMGGLLIFLTLLVSTALWARMDNRFILLMLFTTVVLAFTGWMDDYTKLVKKNPKGASSKFKFSLQLFTAISVVVYLAVSPPNAEYANLLSIPYTKEVYLNLGFLYAALAMLVIIGSSNAVNLTDGLDGLAAGSIVFTALTFAIIAYAAGNVKWASYLKLIYVDGAGEITVFLSALIGSCLGFLWYNAHPAEVFMGDTSSLFLGGAIGTAAIVTKQELLLPVAGGIFLVETLSVILQMGSFKLRNKKRLFLMAPIHHHFELKGIAESKVTVRFWIVGIMLMLIALSSLKIR